MRTPKGVIVAGLALAVLVAAACGGGDGAADTDPMGGIWKGEQVVSDAQTLAAPLCLVVARSTPLGPGQFSGAMYLSGGLIGIAAGMLSADGTVTILTEVNAYQGTRAGDQLSGMWGASGDQLLAAGTWTLERTGDDFCE